MTIKRSQACPCSSGAGRDPQPYGACCAPRHEGTAPAGTPFELVRARYAAFALGQVAFLYETLHPSHRDRALPKDRVELALRAACSSLKYMGLALFEESLADEHGASRALYLARVFRSGVDVSFVELAEFADGQAQGPVGQVARPSLAYVAGETFESPGIKSRPVGLTIGTFPDFVRKGEAAAGA